MTKIVGILNFTPDSFSDGGIFFSKETALNHCFEMLNQNVDVIDIGGESTRPGAEAISSDEEFLRLGKIVPEIVYIVEKYNKDNNRKAKISVDTYHPDNARKFCDMGIDIINDVSGLSSDEMIDIVASKNVKAVFMHSLTVPANPEIIINRALNVSEEIIKWAIKKIDFLQKKSVKKNQLIFDPGIGFSKDSIQSLRIIKNIDIFKTIGLPIYIGHSKKSFLDIVNIKGLENNKSSRAEKTLIISSFLANKKIDYLRVHDVSQNIEAIKSNIFEKFI